MRLEFVRLSVAFANNVSESQRREPGRNVDDGAAGKVQNTERLGPARRTPSPEGERVVDDRGPEENKDCRRDDADTFSGGTEDDGGSLCKREQSERKKECKKRWKRTKGEER